MLSRLWLFMLLISCAWVLAACGQATAAVAPSPVAVDTPPRQSTSTALPVATSTTTTTTTPLPLAVLLAAPGADAEQVTVLQSALEQPIVSAGLRWQVRSALQITDLTAELRLVVAVPPDPGLAELVAAAPQTQFLAIGIPGLAAVPNLSQVAAAGARPDQQGFIAGYIAAMLTPDWRVGVLSVSDTVEGRAARTAFINGVAYFCGLCQPQYPPFYQYPLYGELPATASPLEWQALGDYMRDRYAQTVFVAAGAGDAALLSYLAQAGINLIGVTPPPAGLEDHWVASLRSEPLPLVVDLIPQLLAGQGGQILPAPLQITDVNPRLFSPGRQRLAEETLNELLAGFIDPGVDMASGENK